MTNAMKNLQQTSTNPSTIVASIIVPTYGRPAYLKDLLDALVEHDHTIAHEIVVVDNKPMGIVRDIVEAIRVKGQPFVQYIEEPRTGLHHARHAGAKAAQGQILVYIDDDILPQPGWLKAMLEPFTDPVVAIVGGKVLPQWESAPPEWFSQFHPGHLSLLDLGEERRELKWPEGGYGCNMGIRRSVLYELRGFNPDAFGDRHLIWFRGDGETGLHQKVYQAGYKVMYEPRACVSHRIPAHRLIAKYFYRRSFTQGISDSYSDLREAGNARTSGTLLLRHTVRCYLEAFRFWIKARKHVDQRVRLKSQAWYWYGRGCHHWRVAFSQKLRRHVLSDSYM
jgi:glycosyltransferase involved in cell wall biosynthesis